MSQEYRDHCNANYGPEDIRSYEDDAPSASKWLSMATAPRDGQQILVRRHNDVMYEFYVVWWNGDEPYPWRGEHTAYPSDRLDEWCEIPGPQS